MEVGFWNAKGGLFFSVVGEIVVPAMRHRTVKWIAVECGGFASSEEGTDRECIEREGVALMVCI